MMLYRVFPMLMLCVSAITATSITHGASRNCKAVSSSGAPLAIRQTINGKVVGQIKNTTPVTISNYGADEQGHVWAYVHWQGQPLAEEKRQGLQNEGWINRDNVNCTN